ncbi:hypothetical protein ALQ13_200064 [Pseudomonas savastanoi pv. glycinea]|nr:hypothetical protein ALQ13_200064 [Pseudomonas savastanoi pv. glycinea]RMW32391.1 hypothetical protein ALO96_200053 [Pseudomonas savastanoi pv. glycinea]
MAVALIKHEACYLTLEFSGKVTALFGHQTPLSGDISSDKSAFSFTCLPPLTGEMNHAYGMGHKKTYEL